MNESDFLQQPGRADLIRLWLWSNGLRISRLLFLVEGAQSPTEIVVLGGINIALIILAPWYMQGHPESIWPSSALAYICMAWIINDAKRAAYMRGMRETAAAAAMKNMQAEFNRGGCKECEQRKKLSQN